MHGADEHIDLVALDESVSIVGRLGWLGLVVHGEKFHIAPTKLTAVLLERDVEALCDRGAERRIGTGVREHQTDAQLRRR